MKLDYQLHFHQYTEEERESKCQDSEYLQSSSNEVISRFYSIDKKNRREILHNLALMEGFSLNDSGIRFLIWNGSVEQFHKLFDLLANKHFHVLQWESESGGVIEGTTGYKRFEIVFSGDWVGDYDGEFIYWEGQRGELMYLLGLLLENKLIEHQNTLKSFFESIAHSFLIKNDFTTKNDDQIEYVSLPIIEEEIKRIEQSYHTRFSAINDEKKNDIEKMVDAVMAIAK